MPDCEHLAFGDAGEVPHSVLAAAGGHQHGGRHQLRARHHEFLGEERAHRHRHDPHRCGVELLDERRDVADHLLGGEARRVLGGADPAVVERDDAVAGALERGHLVEVPGPARSPATRDEQNGVPGASVVIR